MREKKVNETTKRDTVNNFKRECATMKFSRHTIVLIE